MSVRDSLAFKSSKLPIINNSDPKAVFQHEVNRLLSDFFGGPFISPLEHTLEPFFAVTPAIDVTESDSELKVTVELPGIDAKNIQLLGST